MMKGEKSDVNSSNIIRKSLLHHSDAFDSEITNLLLVGNSETAFLFSNNLQELANFSLIVHVVKPEDALSLLIEESFNLVVLDHDTEELNTISFSRIVKMNNPISRVIIISQSHTIEFFVEFINLGSVDAYIPIPIDEFSTYSIILEQQAKYEIADTLAQLVKDPPKFSPAYYLLKEPSLLEKKGTRVYEILGCVISTLSVTKYSHFFKDILMIDEYLLSGYISAITILGKQLFSDGLDENNEFHEINFGGISAYFHFHKDIQFSFFVNNLIKSNIQEVDAKTSQTTKKILKKYEDLLNSELPLDDYIQTDIDNIVNSLRSKSVNTKKTKTVPSKIVIFGNSLPKLNSFFKKYKKQFMVKRFFNYNRMIGYLIHNEVDTLIINQNYKEETWNFNYASQIKEVRPDIHLIALIEEYRLDYLLKILNSDYLDFVISYKDNLDQYHIIISKACQSTVEMKKKVSYTTENLLSITQRNPFYTRSMLKSHKSSYELTKIPELYGLFISRENLPYYCKFWPKGGGEFNIDQDLFAGFITSLTTVSYEMFLGEGHYAGLKVGNANVIIRDQFDFTFVFFLGNVDHTNINLIQKHLETTIFLLYDLIHQSEKKYLYEAVGEDLTELLEQHATELFLQFSSLNLINY